MACRPEFPLFQHSPDCKWYQKHYPQPKPPMRDVYKHILYEVTCYSDNSDRWARLEEEKHWSMRSFTPADIWSAAARRLELHLLHFHLDPTQCHRCLRPLVNDQTCDICRKVPDLMG